MRRLILLALISLCSCLVTAQSAKQGTDNAQAQNPTTGSQKPAIKAAPFPLQLEVRVPFAPTAFPSGGHRYLVYELYLTNFGWSPLSLTRIAVLNAGEKAAPPIASFGPQELETLIQLVGSAPLNPEGKLVIAGGQCAIAFMWLEFRPDEIVPDNLLHHVETSGGAEDVAAITTHRSQLHVLGRRWKARTGLQTTDPAMARTTITGGVFLS